ncbi:phytoene/squalene synthase family protein [Tistlia consotensis]|uniref:phytoene/squalene synthase family protein n=1 Tax=Tistlia consotensis TaxID=1321365 RepID=UPI0013562C4A|nr:phytoene/squalene synthase family protein [Tistlia consotensis]
MPTTPRLSYCADLARRRDPDRYAAALFAPSARREALFALIAFNHEIAKTAEVVSEPLLGEIRLTWWQEALGELYDGRPRRHEVVEALAGAVAAHALPRALLERLVEARSADLDAEPPADLDGLERYCAETSATLLELQLAVLGAEGADWQEAARRAARQVGIAWALIGLVRALPFHAGRRRLLLPADHLAAAGVTPRQVFAFERSEALSGVVMRLAKRAAERLDEARPAVAALPKLARAPLLVGALARRYLERLERAGYDPFDPAVAADLPQRAWILAWVFAFGGG